MKRGMNKKGLDAIGEQTVFIILNAVVIMMFVFVIGRAAKGGTLIEQNYAKQIALLIDQSRPGTTIEMDIKELIDYADAVNFPRESTVRVDNDLNTVTVRVTEGKGYSFDFFSGSVLKWGVDRQSKKLIIEVGENAQQES